MSPGVAYATQTGEPATQTEMKAVQPKSKQVEHDTYDTRVVLVCPYNAVSDRMAQFVSDVIPRCEVDIIAEAESSQPPYVDVETYESHHMEPRWVIDFQRLRATVPKRRTNLDKLREGRRNMLWGALRTHINDLLQGDHIVSEQYGDANSDPEELYKALWERMGETMEEYHLIGVMKAWDDVLTHSQGAVKAIGLVPFDGYKLWTQKAGVTYLTPKSKLCDALVRQHRDDADGNLCTEQVDLGDLEELVAEDIENIGRMDELECFRVRV